MTQGGVLMSAKEVREYEIIRKFIAGEMDGEEAISKLGIKERALYYRAKKVRELGILGAKHQNSGRIPANKTPKEVVDKLKQIKSEELFDFNMKHALEVIEEEFKEQVQSVSYPTFRRICVSNHLEKRRYKRKKKVFVLRDRFPRRGQLIQLDGTPHRFNGKDEWVLISAIDDADSNVLYGEFFDGETTLACLKVLYQIVIRFGVPEAFYIDKAGWGGGQKRQNFSHFEKACEELGIEIIYADSPQAKGRIERSNYTHQDRLCPVFRRKEIKTKADATKYFNGTYLSNYWRKKCIVKPSSEESAYRPTPIQTMLKEIVCITPETNAGLAKGTIVEVRTYPDNTWAIFANNRPLTLRIAPPNRQPDHRYLSKLPRGNKELDKIADSLGYLQKSLTA